MARHIVKSGLFAGSLLLGFAVASSCGEPEAKKDNTTTTSGTDAATDADDAGDGADGGTTSTKDPAAAAKLWINSIKPAFEAKCASCHAEPRFVVAKRGPLTIFSYDSAKKMLADGVSSTDNKMIRKPTGGDDHGGGAQCTVDTEPCSFIVQWRLLEIGNDPDPSTIVENLDVIPADADPRTAAIANVSTGGVITGWAVDKASMKVKVNVKVVLDGLLGAGGVVAATTTADKLVDDGKHPGTHGFFVTLAESFRTGVARDYYLYNDKDELLTPTKATYKSFAPTAAGRAFFNNTVAAKITAKCSSCHTANYDQFYAALSGMGPNEGGTASNNNAVNKPGGVAPHNGGNACGGINTSPCAEFQQWWPLEFGP